MSADSRMPAEERRLQIIQSAGEVFAKYGYEGARIKDIADQCGINEAILYKHFSGKEELFREFLTYHYETISGRWVDMMNAQPDGLTGLKTILHSQLDVVGNDAIGTGAMLHGVAQASNDQNIRAQVLGYFQNHHDRLTGLIKRGIEDGSVVRKSDEDISRLALLFRSIVWAHLIFVKVGLTDQLIGAKSRDIIDDILDGLARKD